ncbi:hypothetical protein CLOP_g7364 [Closterium sp. NIES-67]|nr:hypothetical protein CLOP_g7364 [Closterium sp. NIES-67]
MSPGDVCLHALQVAGVLLLLLHVYGWSVAAINRLKSLDRLRSRRASTSARPRQRSSRRLGAQRSGNNPISYDDGDLDLDLGPVSRASANTRCPHWPAVAVVMPVKGFHAHTASNWATHVTADYPGPVEFLVVVESEADDAYSEALKLAARFDTAYNGENGQKTTDGAQGGREGGGQGKGGREQGEEGGSPCTGEAECGGEALCEGEAVAPDKPGNARPQQGEVHLRKVRVVVAGTSTTCSQKIHNQLAGVAAARPEAEFVLFLDDDARMFPEAISYLVTDLLSKPDTFLVTGYPFDIPSPKSLFSYAVLGFHLVPLVNFSYDAVTEYIWGGCMMLRLGDFRSNRLGMVDVLRMGGYSDDMTLGAVGSSIKRGGSSSISRSSSSRSSSSSRASSGSSKACKEESWHGYGKDREEANQQKSEKGEQQPGSISCRVPHCAQHLKLSGLMSTSMVTSAAASTYTNLPMLAPAYALLAHPLDQHFTAIQFWSYLRRQLFALTTYATPLNRRLNLWLLVMGMAFSTVMVGSMAVSLAFLAHDMAVLLASLGRDLFAIFPRLLQLALPVVAAPVCSVPVISTICHALPSSVAAAAAAAAVSQAGTLYDSTVQSSSPLAAAATANLSQPSDTCPAANSSQILGSTCSVPHLAITNSTAHSDQSRLLLILHHLPSHAVFDLSLPLGVSLALLHLLSFALATLALRAMIAAHIQTCRFLDPGAPFALDDAAYREEDGGGEQCDYTGQYALWRVWVGYLIHNGMYPFCAILTYCMPYIDWAGIRYRRHLGRISRV